MTTLPRYNGVDEILSRLDSVRARRWTMMVLTGLVAVATIVLASLLVLAASMGYWPDQPPAALRWTLLAVTCLAWAGVFYWFLLRALMWRQLPAQVARFIEEATPEMRNNLINAVLLSRDAQQVSPELVQQAIHETVRQSRRMDLGKAVSPAPLLRWGIALLSGMILLTTFALLQPGPFKRGLLAVITPARYVPTEGTIELISLQPGDATRFAGEQVTLLAKIRNDSGKPLHGEVLLDGAAPKEMPASDGYTTYSLPMGQVDQTFKYAVRIGDSRWPNDRPYYTVTVLKKVQVEGLDMSYTYPAYTNLEKKTVHNADGSIQAPIGSVASVTLRVSTPVPAAVLGLASGASVTMSPATDNRSFTADIPVTADGAYFMELRDASGHTIQRLPDLGDGSSGKDVYSQAGRSLMQGTYRIQALPDASPKIEFVTPGRDEMVAPNGKLKIKAKARDDYGLTSATLEVGLDGKKTTPVPEFTPADITGKKDKEIEYVLDLKGYEKGAVVVYFATATDNRNLPTLGLGPQTGTSKQYKITIQDPAEVAADKARRQEELRNRLLTILRMQEEQRVSTDIAWKKLDAVEEVKTSGTAIAAGQRKIKAELLALAGDNALFDEEMVPVQQAVALLGNNEAQTAIDQAVVLTTLTAMDRRDKSCSMLGDTQSKIIETLQTLLSIMPSLASKPTDEKKSPKSDQLPPDVRDKLEKLRNDLEQFQEQEKKAIKAAERLAKKPVDSFTPEDEKLLKDLEATQDKWEKFINEAMTDFSKLAQQDFANPSMLKELVSVKSDVTMAKDALKQKASEIATALEDNGIENAKSLTANIEKWLPDTPDRTKWAMEDPGNGQDKVEQAELPTELEDLVGDLLENEEDLFDEADDVTSKYTQSGDKGIGWDAMDGPIANMNAQGVTGNQLPNTNEMGGRSGEGRSGKSSGEFVEDKAVGKGGRRTPTRLSPEPFQKGQINDQSTEPPGGATGGGKMSGSGEEGLEGPVPPPVKQEMKRLAGKQASLLQQAERMQSKFKVSDHSNFKMMDAVTLMNRVKSDLENYRYRNILRERDTTLGALKQAGLLLTGKIDVAADSTANMPKYIRQDIADAMKGKLPDEYRDVLEQYFRKLSETGGK